jgi:hypothetical protein
MGEAGSQIMPPPDEFVQVDRYIGPGTLKSDETGESIEVFCRFFLFKRMLWCGDGEPRSEGSPVIEGTVAVPGNRYWAHNHLLKRFSIHLAENKQLHFAILDGNGKIGNIDSRWKP